MTSDDIQKRLGENVKRIRKEQNLTQFQLAEKADLSEETVKNIELSRCWTSDKNLSKLTKALEVDICQLFFPISSSFNEDSKEAGVIKNAIAGNLRRYVDTVLEEVLSGGYKDKPISEKAIKPAATAYPSRTESCLTPGGI